MKIEMKIRIKEDIIVTTDYLGSFAYIREEYDDGSSAWFVRKNKAPITGTHLEEAYRKLINKPVETTNEQPNKQYRELLRWMEADKDVQNYPTGNKFFNSTNGGFTIMLKPDGTYEVDYEFK